jgi:hypothetical protein
MNSKLASALTLGVGVVVLGGISIGSMWYLDREQERILHEHDHTDEDPKESDDQE